MVFAIGDWPRDVAMRKHHMRAYALPREAEQGILARTRWAHHIDQASGSSRFHTVSFTRATGRRCQSMNGVPGAGSTKSAAPRKGSAPSVAIRFGQLVAMA